MSEINNTKETKDIRVQLEEIRRENRIFKIAVVSLMSVAVLISGYWYKQSQGYASSAAENDDTTQLSNSAAGGCGGSGGGCGSSSGGGCGSGGSEQISAPELEKQALELFTTQFGKVEGAQVKVMDLGCHQEVNILDQNNNILQRYSFRDGQLTPL